MLLPDLLSHDFSLDRKPGIFVAGYFATHATILILDQPSIAYTIEFIVGFRRRVGAFVDCFPFGRRFECNGCPL
jgi:hypothetical protein